MAKPAMRKSLNVNRTTIVRIIAAVERADHRGARPDEIKRLIPGCLAARQPNDVPMREPQKPSPGVSETVIDSSRTETRWFHGADIGHFLGSRLF
jgi:hypothetical protein